MNQIVTLIIQIIYLINNIYNYKLRYNIMNTNLHFKILKYQS